MSARKLDTDLTLRVARVVPDTDSEGPGRRFAIWVQGCPLRCDGCCNPEMLPASGGKSVSVGWLARQVIATEGIEGITLLGGEPVAQAEAVAELCRQVAAADLGVLLFTGYTLDALRQQAASQPSIAELLVQTDLIVDGPYDASLPEREATRPRRWIGSRNQQLHCLTERYDPKDSRFFAYNTVEIRWDGRKVLVNGWPAAADALLSFREQR